MQSIPPQTFALRIDRSQVFPLFIVETMGEVLQMKTRKFIGTGFFVTKSGHAITAAHLLPIPLGLDHTHRLIGLAHINGVPTTFGVKRVNVLEDYDLGLIHTNLSPTNPLPLAVKDIYAGHDVQVIGFPEHEVRQQGKEMRVLKGHVSLSREVLELNFPIPPGMSGGPVFSGPAVAAYATGRVRSEEIEDQTEEIVTVSDATEQVRITTTSRITYYGLARSFYELRAARIPDLDNKTLFEFISEVNGGA